MNKAYWTLLVGLVVAGLSWTPASAGYIAGMPYFHQYSNRINPSGSCQNTCIAIVLKYYVANDITPDRISAKWGTYKAQSTGGLEAIFNEEAALRGLSARDRSTPNGTLQELHALLDAGRPVIVHGGFSEVGHLLVLIGYDERFYYVMDPASKWTERVNGGFTNKDDSEIGRYTRYDRAAVENAIVSTGHRNFVRMHAIYFEEGDLAATWEGSITDSVAVGSAVELAGYVRVHRADSEGPEPRVYADLSAVGGPAVLEFREEGEGLYPLAEAFAAGGITGRNSITFFVRQGEKEAIITRDVVILPSENQVIFAREFGPNWRQGFIANVDLALREAEPGREALAVEASGFTLEYLPLEPLNASGYRALRFSFHPGEATTGLRGAFSLQLNEDPRKVENLIDGFLAGVDMERREWQQVEVPLWAFAPLEDPIYSIRLFGNLRGTFYLDDIELVSALFPAPHLKASWQGLVPDSLTAGSEFELRERIRVSSTEEDGPLPEVFADLSDLGGPSEVALDRVGEGVYLLAAKMRVDVPNGLKALRVHIRQNAADKLLETTLVRELVVLPASDQVVFADRYGENWQQGCRQCRHRFRGGHPGICGQFFPGARCRRVYLGIQADHSGGSGGLSSPASGFPPW